MYIFFLIFLFLFLFDLRISADLHFSIWMFVETEHLIADEFSAELSDGLAYVAGHDDESRPVMVISFWPPPFGFVICVFEKNVRSFCRFLIVFELGYQIFRMKQDYQKLHSQKLWVFKHKLNIFFCYNLSNKKYSTFHACLSVFLCVFENSAASLVCWCLHWKWPFRPCPKM